MSSPLIHPTHQGQIEALLAYLPQSLILSGPIGVGLTGISNHLADQLGAKPQIVLPEKDEKVNLERGTISVDSIRRLYEATRTIETGKRIIIIDYAERMGQQAQNAFLKLLEEPGVNTHFILLTHEASRLLPTIVSRAQQIELSPITREQSEALLDELGITDPTKRSQLLFMADGLPAELTRLAADDAYFTSRVQIVRDARSFLSGNHYDRLKLAHSYKDDRQMALQLVTDTLNLVRLNVTEGKTDLIPKIDQLLKAYERIEGNGNIRLQLASAMV